MEGHKAFDVSKKAPGEDDVYTDNDDEKGPGGRFLTAGIDEEAAKPREEEEDDENEGTPAG